MQPPPPPRTDVPRGRRLAQIAAPQMAVKVIDRAIQAHGGAGFSGDFPLAFAYAQALSLTLANPGTIMFWFLGCCQCLLPSMRVVVNEVTRIV